jgi:hypothetical protein
MRNKIIILLGLVFVLFANSFAQQNPPPVNTKSETPRFRISPVFPVNVSTTYKLTETSNFKRYFQDSTFTAYSRKVIYFISVRASSAPLNNIQTVTVSIDSMIYNLKDDSQTINFNSQNDNDVPPFKTKDFEANFVPVGKDFDIVYSPYHEIVKLTGERYNTLVENWKDSTQVPKDSFKKFYWLKGFSTEVLSFLGDVHKGLMPMFRASIDTTWNDKVHLVIDGVSLNDNVNLKLVSFNSKAFTIEGHSEQLSLDPTQARFHGVETFIDVHSGTGKTDYKLLVNPQGIVELLEIKIKADMKCTFDKTEFNQNVDTKFTWEKIKMYNW